MKTEICKNVSVTLRPDTIQRSYMNLKEENFNVEVLTFPDGSLKVTIPEMTESHIHMICVVSANIKHMNDLMVVAQVKDIIARFDSNRFINLEILSTAYTRYDRVMHADKTDGFGAKVFADFVKSIGFSFITIFDSHSEVMTNLLNAINIEQDVLVEATLKKFDLDTKQFNLIAPDKGATKKLKDPDMVFDKVRDQETGKITGMELAFDDSNDKKDFLVIDDICEGGRTFIEVAKLFNETKTGSLNLYVTHGIFSNNAIEKLLDYYDNIYVYFTSLETYNSLNEEMKSRVKVLNFLN